ncbi:MAG: AraC family transcriptional regulator [Oscillospiraceae bacterium]|jgi:AraC family transcriptional regulator|nr:AraC family transcriptional regulator [Oscillospiraceae bacterium]
MHAWEAIQRTVDFIEDNLEKETEIEQLANIAYLSPFYFQRLFTRLVKKPVREYIKLRRLALACKTLTSKNVRILDIALDCGFSSHEFLTKTFKEAFGITPDQYRKNPVPLVQFSKPALALNYVMIDEGVPLITDGIVLEFNRKEIKEPIFFMGINGIVKNESHIFNGETTGIDTLGQVWEKFHQQQHLIPMKIGGRTLDVSYKGEAPENCFTFFVGTEVEANIDNEIFAKWQVLPYTYVICGFEAESFEQLVTDTIYKAWKYSYIWLKKHGLSVDKNITSPEMYYPNLSDTNYMELWLAIENNYVE